MRAPSSSIAHKTRRRGSMRRSAECRRKRLSGNSRRLGHPCSSWSGCGGDFKTASMDHPGRTRPPLTASSSGHEQASPRGEATGSASPSRLWLRRTWILAIAASGSGPRRPLAVGVVLMALFHCGDDLTEAFKRQSRGDPTGQRVVFQMGEDVFDDISEIEKAFIGLLLPRPEFSDLSGEILIAHTRLLRLG